MPRGDSFCLQIDARDGFFRTRTEPVQIQTWFTRTLQLAVLGADQIIWSTVFTTRNWWPCGSHRRERGAWCERWSSGTTTHARTQRPQPLSNALGTVKRATGNRVINPEAVEQRSRGRDCGRGQSCWGCGWRQRARVTQCRTASDILRDTLFSSERSAIRRIYDPIAEGCRGFGRRSCNRSGRRCRWSRC